MKYKKIIVCLLLFSILVVYSLVLSDYKQMLFFSDNMNLPVWSVALVCTLTIVLIYIKNAVNFVRDKKYFKLIFLSVSIFLLCLLFLIMCCNYYK